MSLLGCMGMDCIGEDEPRLGAVPVVRNEADVRRLALPLDPYMDNLAFVDLVERASDVLVQECMGRYQLTWPRYLPAGDPDRPEHLRRWGITDADEAAQHGYLSQAVIAARDDPPSPSVSADAVAVAVGRVREFNGLAVPEGGCFGKANRRMSGSEGPGTRTDVGIGRRLSNEAYGYTLRDSRMKRLFARWSDCMKREGLHYERPWDASGDPAWSEVDTDRRPTADEVATARVDIKCRLELNLVGTWYAVDVGYQTRALNENREQLEHARDLLLATERRAREVLSKSGHSATS